ncbi:hypothetical protein [Neisseria weaveri]|uniref:hypothetical protein n=1 Tax=Neisseria weaveri TaxID=28091 RepID=UPI00031A285F|nr:hypothetical protein [Neisseria weaveri]
MNAIMKKLGVVAMSAWLCACGQSGEPAAQEAVPPKPAFTVKYIDEAVVMNRMPVSLQSEFSKDGKAVVRFAINGLSDENFIDLTGEHRDNAESLGGKCMEYADDGKKLGWPAGGVCHTAFRALAGNVVADADAVTAYLLAHAGLQPLSDKDTYAAVQDGRYVLDVDNTGLFAFRRR